MFANDKPFLFGDKPGGDMIEQAKMIFWPI